MKYRTHTVGGFTLIEVIGAMVVFASGVLVAAALSRDITALLRDARFRSEAGVIGRQTMDSLALHTYEDFPIGTTAEGTVTLSGVAYSRSWVTTQFGPRTRAVTVQVAPPIDDGRSCLGTTFCATMYVVEEW